MYGTLLVAHSWLRWVVVILALWVVVAGVLGWMRRWSDAKHVSAPSLFFIIALDIQLLLGLGLFFVAPTTTMFMSDPGASMGDRILRFWGVEHAFGMFVALVLAHIGRAKIRRAADAFSANKAAAIFIGLALLIMLLSIPWPALPYGRPLLRM